MAVFLSWAKIGETVCSLWLGVYSFFEVRL